MKIELKNLSFTLEIEGETMKNEELLKFINQLKEVIFSELHNEVKLSRMKSFFKMEK